MGDYTLNPPQYQLYISTLYIRDLSLIIQIYSPDFFAIEYVNFFIYLYVVHNCRNIFVALNISNAHTYDLSFLYKSLSLYTACSRELFMHNAQTYISLLEHYADKVQ